MSAGPSRGKVLLIGATGGVGQAAAQRLAAEGFHVIGTCRTAAQARELKHAGHCRQVLRMSLGDDDSISAAFLSLEKSGLTELAGLVNCAAVTQPRPIELLSMRDLRNTFEINLFGAVAAIRKALPLLRAARGRIVLVSSTSGSLAVPLLGAYSASKFALEAIADVLRREVAQWQIGVSLVIPGGIRTPMIARQLAEIESELAALAPGIESRYAEQYRQHRTVIEVAEKTAVPPQQVAADVLRALTDARPRTRYLCGTASKSARAMRRLLPDGVIDRIFVRLPAGKQ